MEITVKEITSALTIIVLCGIAQYLIGDFILKVL